jgi:hypothetical protein
MGFKRTWYASAIGEVWQAMRHRHEGNVTTGMRRSVFLPVTLDEGAPAKDVGRPVMIRMPATVAADLGYRMIREAREARRSDVREGLASGPVYADKHSRLGMVRRFLADYAEETGATNDPVEDHIADLVTDLLSLSRDSERVIERTRDYLRENN